MGSGSAQARHKHPPEVGYIPPSFTPLSYSHSISPSIPLKSDLSYTQTALLLFFPSYTLTARLRVGAQVGQSYLLPQMSMEEGYVVNLRVFLVGHFKVEHLKVEQSRIC